MSDKSPLLSTREVATGIWMVLVFGALMVKSTIRKPFASVVRSALSWKLMVPVLVMAAYVTAIIVWLESHGLWTTDLLKDTLLWFILSGIALMFSGLNRSADRRGFWRRLVVDQIKATIVFEWLVNTFTFSLGVELAMFPVLLIITVLDAVASTKEVYAPVRRITSWLLVAVGFYLFGSALGTAAAQLQVKDVEPTLKTLALAPVLSLSVVPLAYAFAIIAVAETTLLQLKFSVRDVGGQGLHAYAIRKILIRCRFSPRKVGQFMRVYRRNLHGVASRSEIDRVMELSRKSRRDIGQTEAIALN